MNLVLLPGFMTDADLWSDIVARLAEVGPVAHGDLARDAAIADMARRVAAEAPARFGLIGFSMGGYVARAVARLVPDRVEALVLVATSSRADTPAQARRKAAAVAHIRQQGYRGLSRAAILQSVHPDRAGDGPLLARIRQMGDRLGGEVFLRQAGQARDPTATASARSAARPWSWRRLRTPCAASTRRGSSGTASRARP
ncbi:alpha/beta fold hydrolase [Methylobacterium oryzae CBMB20]